MKIAICDDDSQELDHIICLLNTYISINNLTGLLSYQTFNSSFDLAEKAPKEKYDLYLLDVIMPCLNGIDLAGSIRSFDKAADIIFLTTSSEFAVESYRIKASNYLLKPLVEKDFFNALDDIISQSITDEKKYIIVKSSIGVHKIEINNIVYIEAFNRRTIYHLSNREKIETSDKFNDCCNALMQYSEFILAHRSILVNMNYIKIIDNADIYLQDSSVIPLAQRRVSEIKKHYLAYQMEESL